MLPRLWHLGTKAFFLEHIIFQVVLIPPEIDTVFE
jgi:hypothetical protein